MRFMNNWKRTCLKLVTTALLALAVISQINAAGEQYIDAYNELAKGLNLRLKAVGADQLTLKKAGSNVSQVDLEIMRWHVIGLMKNNFVVNNTPQGDLSRVDNINQMFQPGIQYEDGTDLFGNQIIKPGGLFTIGNGNAFTKIPGKIMSSGTTIYANSFFDVPLLWIHFTELKDAISKLTILKKNVNLIDTTSRYTKLCYHSSMPSSCCYIYSTTDGVETKPFTEGWESFEKSLKYAQQAWSWSQWFTPVNSDRIPSFSTEFYCYGRYNEFGYLSFSANHVSLTRTASRFSTPIPDDDLVSEAKFHSLQLIVYDPDKDTSLVGPVNQGSSEKSVHTESALFSSGCYITSKIILKEDTPPPFVPNDNPFPHWNGNTTSASKSLPSTIFIAKINATDIMLTDPEGNDPESDGVLATGCTCTTCPKELIDEIKEQNGCPEVRWPLGVGNGNIDYLKVLSYISERKYNWGTVQDYNLNTHIMGNYGKMEFNSNYLPIGTWNLTQVKRPSGYEILFNMLDDGKPLNGKKYQFKVNPDTSIMELYFPSSDGAVYHIFNGGSLQKCRKIVEKESLETTIHNTPCTWNGLKTNFITNKPNLNISTVVSCNMIYARLSYTPVLDDEANILYHLVSGVKYTDVNGVPIQELIAMRQRNGNTSTTRYSSYTYNDQGEQQLSSCYQYVYDEETETTTHQVLEIASNQPTDNIIESTVYSRSINADGNLVARKVHAKGTESTTNSTTYKTFEWGDEIIEEVYAADTPDQEKTVYAYYDDPADTANYSNLKSVRNNDGSWSRYAYDAEGRTTKTITPYGNSPITAAESLCRVTEYDYTPLEGVDKLSLGDDFVDHRVRCTTQKVNDTPVSKSFSLFFNDKCLSVRAASATAAWDASANLTSQSFSYEDGEFKGRTRKNINPDGSMTLYSYALDADGGLTTTVESGTGSGDSITSGTRSVSHVNSQGHTTMSQSFDIESNLKLSETTYVMDAWGRPTRVNYMDGTFSTTEYGCCGADKQTSRDGTVTEYTYDQLKRMDSSTVNGISTLYTYDIDGNVISTTVKGKNDAEITSSNTYNKAGELLTSTDTMGNITKYSESIDENGRRTTTTTYPNGTTATQIYNLDGSLAFSTGTAVHGTSYQYGIENGELYTKVFPTANSAQWVKSFTDFLGRNYKTLYADNTATQTFYDNVGRPVKQIGLDGVISLTQYNTKGEVELTAIDMNRNGIIDKASKDRITEYESSITTAHSTTVSQRKVYVYNTDDADTKIEVSSSESAIDGTKSWSTSFGRTSSSTTTIDPQAVTKTIVSTSPDNSTVTQNYENGLLTTTVHSTLGTTSYTYDPFNRLETETRTINSQPQVTRYTYNLNGQVKTITDPANRVTTYHYDNMGRRTKVDMPGNQVVNYAYAKTGELVQTHGTNTYPVEYNYDNQGRMQKLITFKDFNKRTGSAETTWNYSPERGFMTSKLYDNGKGTSYQYYPSGALHVRTWARTVASQPLTTTYTYDNGGSLANVDYSDSTPDITYNRDRLGRPATVADAIGSHTIGYNVDGSVDNVALPQLSGYNIDYDYDNLGRRTDTKLMHNTDTVTQTAYTYDAMSRLATVGNGTVTATYARIPGSSMLHTTTINNGTTDALVTTRGYDNLNRLLSIASVSSVTKSYTYEYNDRDQRTKCTLADGSYWLYQYDELGQVTSGRKYKSDDSPIPGQDFGYNFDDIGNRKNTATNGSKSVYTSNELNQYTKRTIPNTVFISGSADLDTTVKIIRDPDTPGGDPSVAVPTRSGKYFYKEFKQNNSQAASSKKYTTYVYKTNPGDGKIHLAKTEKTITTPKNPEAYTYDQDGNLLTDGQYTYKWNAENRLISIESTSSTQSTQSTKIEFTYDYQGRRTLKNIYSYDTNTNAYVLDKTITFVYDGWNEIARFTDNTLTKTYTWGEDLSGSLQGAGGVGGLLATKTYTSPTTYTTYLPTYDGNGNITSYIKATDGVEVASYEYSPFGRTITQSGSDADKFDYKFSTKPMDNETELYYYIYRYYDPEVGRWLSRDPIGIKGGVNIYGFVGNDGLNLFDLLGNTSFNSIPSQLIYTWKLGWVDSSHYNVNTLDKPWAILKATKANKKICLPITLSQESGFAGYSMTNYLTNLYEVKVGSSLKKKKEQLLHMWMQSSIAFESMQSGWFQTNVMTKLIEILKWDKEKIPSGFSSEDLVSNLIHYYHVVDDISVKKIIDSAIPFSGNESKTVWLSGFKAKDGYKSFKPLLHPATYNYNSIMRMSYIYMNQPDNPPLDIGYEEKIYKKSLSKIFLKYYKQNGPAHRLNLLDKYSPDASGVKLIESKQGFIANKKLSKLINDLLISIPMAY